MPPIWPITPHEHFGSLHRQARCDDPVDVGCGPFGHRGVHASAGGAASQNRRAGDLCDRSAAGRQSREHGGHRCHPIGKTSWGDLGCRRHDLHQHCRQHEHPADFRHRPGYRRRRSRRAGRDCRGARGFTLRADEKSFVSKDQQLEFPGSSFGDDLGCADARADLRRGGRRDLAAPVADQRRRRRKRRRCRTAGCARRHQSTVLVQVRHRPAGHPGRHFQFERQCAERRDRIGSAALSDLHER